LDDLCYLSLLARPSLDLNLQHILRIIAFINMRLLITVAIALSAITVNGRVIQSSTSPRDDALLSAPLDTTAAIDGFDATGPAWAAPPTEERPMYVPYPPASSDYWEKVKCHGQAFLSAMHGTDIEAGKLFVPVRQTAASTFSDPGNRASSPRYFPMLMLLKQALSRSGTGKTLLSER
jgi:hypothetical protein